jgi:ribonuclease P protein component
MNARFRKSDRIIQQRDFDRAHASELFGADEVLVVKGVRNGLPGSRLGLSVSRRVGNAVIRNRWKRLIREAFRLQRDKLPTGWDWVVRPRRGAEPSARKVAGSLAMLTKRIDKFARRAEKAHDDSLIQTRHREEPLSG